MAAPAGLAAVAYVAGSVIIRPLHGCWAVRSYWLLAVVRLVLACGSGRAARSGRADTGRLLISRGVCRPVG